MKTIKNQRNGLVQRLSDVAAHEKVKNHMNWVFCPNSEWKKLDPDSDMHSDYRKGQPSYQ